MVCAIVADGHTLSLPPANISKLALTLFVEIVASDLLVARWIMLSYIVANSLGRPIIISVKNPAVAEPDASLNFKKGKSLPLYVHDDCTFE